MDRELIATTNGARAYDGRDGQGARARLSTTELVHLITLMKEHSELQEITIEHEIAGFKLTLRKPAPVTVVDAAPPAHGVVVGEPEDMEELDDAHVVEPEPSERGIEICAPLVGIFRSSVKPGSEPLIGHGDAVRQGQVVAAIEALNVLNEVEAAAAGRVRQVLATDGQPVEYGQVLFIIEPAS